MFRSLLTDKQKQFVQDNPQLPNSDMVQQLNEKFNTNFTYAQIKQYRYTHKLIYQGKYPQYIKNYIKKHYRCINKCHSNAQEIAQNIKTLFNFDITTQQVRSQAVILNCCTYPKQKQKKGRPLLDERIRHSHRGKNNTLEIKTLNGWIPKKQYVWNNIYGSIPHGYVILQLDKNFKNCDIDNLMCIPRSLLARINCNKTLDEPKDIAIQKINQFLLNDKITKVCDKLNENKTNMYFRKHQIEILRKKFNLT